MVENNLRHIHQNKRAIENLVRVHDNLNNNKKEKKSYLTKRAYAFSIDFFLIGLINKAVIFTYANFMKTNFFYIPPEKQMTLMGNLYQLHFPLLFFIFWGYFLSALYLGNGQTPGKVALHLRIIDKDGSQHLTMQECFMRTMGYFICVVSGFFLLALPYLTKDARGIPDWLSNTKVFTKKELQELEAYDDHSIQLDLFKHVIPRADHAFHFERPANETESDTDPDTELKVA